MSPGAYRQIPLLPVEIISKVLENVPRDSLLNVLTVNSTFMNAALPLLYRRFYFEPKRVHKRGHVQKDHLQHVKVLDIYDHGAKDCEKLKVVGLSPEVVRIHCNETIASIHTWHGDAHCPLLDLKPESVVFVDFNATQDPPKQAAKTRLYPDAKHRVLVWDVSFAFDMLGFSYVRELVFPTEKGDSDLDERCWAINNGRGGEPKPDDFTHSEVIILSNNRGSNVSDDEYFFGWFERWVEQHTRKKHVFVNLKALHPCDDSFIDSIEERLWRWCAAMGEDLDLPFELDNFSKTYGHLMPLHYTNWPRIEKYYDQALKFLTPKEIQNLLPPREMEAAMKERPKAKKS